MSSSGVDIRFSARDAVLEEDGDEELTTCTLCRLPLTPPREAEPEPFVLAVEALSTSAMRLGPRESRGRTEFCRVGEVEELERPCVEGPTSDLLSP